MRRACGWQPPSWDVLPLVWCSWKKKMCVCICRVCPVRVCVYAHTCTCVFQSTSSASFLLCQSVAAMEHPGLAQPSITCPPWLSAYRHTHIHSWVHTNLWQTSVHRKPRPPATLLKGYSCCVRGRGAKKIFSPKIQHRQQVVLLRHFLSFSACHTLLIAIWRT